MRYFDTNIWTRRVLNLIALVQMGALGSFWASSASSSTERAAIFVRPVAIG